MPSPTFIVATACHAVRDQAALVILNDNSSQGSFTVRRLSVRPLCPSGLTPGTWQIVGTTAQSDGDVAIPAIAADSTASALNSLVLFQKYPTVTKGSTVFFSRQVMPFGTASVGAPATGMGANCSFARMDTATFFDAAYGNTTQAVVLREGQGIALVPGSTTDMPVNAVYDAQITLRRGTDTFYAYCSLTPHASKASFGIFNGTGSGEVIEVLGVAITYAGNPTIAQNLLDAPLVRFARVYGCSGGQVVTPITLDSGYSLPTGLSVVKNSDWNPIDINPYLATTPHGVSAATLAYPGANDAIVRGIGVVRTTMPSIYSVMSAGVGSNQAGAFTSEFQQSAENGWDLSGGGSDIQGFQAGPGYGIAVISDNQNAYSAWWIEAEILYQPALNYSGVSMGIMT